MNGRYVISVAVFGVFLAGCSDVEIANEETSSRNVIGFNVSGNAAETRAVPVNSSNLRDKDLSVFAYTQDGTAVMGTVNSSYQHDGTRVKWYGDLNKWYYSKPADLRYWPTEDNPLDFYAVCPGTTIGRADEHYEWEFNSGFQKVHYKCLDEFNAGSSMDIQVIHENHDVMYGIAKKQVYSTHKGVVTFHFKHILSQIVFKARKNQESMTVTIKDIRLHNIKRGGTFTYPAVRYTTAEIETGRDCWSRVDESDTYSPYILKDKNISVGTDDTDITVGGKSPSLVIPQGVTAWTVSGDDKKTITEADAAGQSYLSVVCVLRQNGRDLTTVDDAGYATIYMPFSADWMPGKRYVYTLRFGGGYDENGNAILVPVNFDAEVEEWDDETLDVNY